MRPISRSVIFSFFVFCSCLGLLPAEAELGPEFEFPAHDFGLLAWPKDVRGLKDELLEFSLALQCLRNCNEGPARPSLESKKAKVWLEVPQGGRFVHFHEEEEDESFSVWLPFDFDPSWNSSRNEVVHFNASLLGIYSVRFYVILINGTKQYLAEAAAPEEVEVEEGTQEAEVRLVIGRDKTKLQFINAIFSLLMVVAMFMMGMDIELAVVWKVLKRPIGPAIGFISQFLFMPLCAWGIGELLLTQDYEKLGLILLGSSPGGSHSNFWTALLGGDVNLSVAMTFVSSVASFGMTSLWVFLLGSQYAEKDIKIPYHLIAASLAMFVIPLALGSWFKQKWPAKAEVVRQKLAKPFFAIILIIVPVTGTLTNLYYFKLVTWRHLLAGLFLGGAGYCLGAALAFLCRQGRPQIIAISLETAIQNGGIAFVVLALTFPSPYSELGMIPVISFFFCSTGPILFVVYGFFLLYKCVFGQTNKAEEEKEDINELKAKLKASPESEV